MKIGAQAVISVEETEGRHAVVRTGWIIASGSMEAHLAILYIGDIIGHPGKKLRAGVRLFIVTAMMLTKSNSPMTTERLLIFQPCMQIGQLGASASLQPPVAADFCVGQLETDDGDPDQSRTQYSRHPRCYGGREEVPFRCRIDRRHATDWCLGFTVGLFGEQG